MITRADFRIFDRFPVHWGDMDAARHVNNTVYLTWTESCRLTYLRAMGVSTSFSGPEAGPILSYVDCKYIFPMTYPDTAIVGMRTLELRADRVIMQSAVFSEVHDRIAALSEQHLVTYDYGALRKVPLPEQWRRAIAKIEGWESSR